MACRIEKQCILEIVCHVHFFSGCIKWRIIIIFLWFFSLKNSDSMALTCSTSKMDCNIYSLSMHN